MKLINVVNEFIINKYEFGNKKIKVGYLIQLLKAFKKY